MRFSKKNRGKIFCFLAVVGIIIALITPVAGFDEKPPLIAFILALELHDRNNDGVLDSKELSGIRWARQRNRLIAFDTDGDGNVSSDELRNMTISFLGRRTRVLADKFFQKFDVDGNGKISSNEAAKEESLDKLFKIFFKSADAEISKEDWKDLEDYLLSVALEKKIKPALDLVGKSASANASTSEKIIFLLADTSKDKVIQENEVEEFLIESVGSGAAAWLTGKMKVSSAADNSKPEPGTKKNEIISNEPPIDKVEPVSPAQVATQVQVKSTSKVVRAGKLPPAKARVLVESVEPGPETRQKEYDMVKDLLDTAGEEEILW